MTREPIPILNLPGDEDFIRLPGLFRRWELNDVVEERKQEEQSAKPWTRARGFGRRGRP